MNLVTGFHLHDGRGTHKADTRHRLSNGTIELPVDGVIGVTLSILQSCRLVLILVVLRDKLLEKVVVELLERQIALR